MKTRVLTIAGLATVLLLAACAGKRGRIMGDDEEDFVGNDRGGAATYDRLISSCVEKISKLRSAAATPSGKLKIAVFGVENKTVEELRDFQEQIYDLLTTSINRTERYEHISRRFVTAALRESRLGVEDMFIPAKRRQFMQTLEQSGNPVDALIFPKLTSGSTSAGSGTTQRNYLLTLELVDVVSGKTEQVAERVRKQYDR